MAKLRVTSDALVGLVAVVTLPAGILSAMLFGEGIAGIVFVVGWLLLVPAIAILAVLDIVLGGVAVFLLTRATSSDAK